MIPNLYALLALQGAVSVASPLARQVTAAAANVARTPSNGQAFIYAFGDSYSAIGYDPTGSEQPTLTNPLGIPDALADTTSGDGHTNWVQKLTQNHTPQGITTLTYDYAVYGALINSTRYPKARKVTDFLTQTQQFLFAGTRPAFNSTQSAVVTYWGTNDIVAHTTSSFGNNFDNSVIEATMDDYWVQMEYFYAAGVRNYVVLLADPVERAPSAVAAGVPLLFAESLLMNRAEWNKQLLQRVASFKTAHPDSKIEAINTDPIFNDILDYPQNYGSPNNTCYNSNGVSCLWWDTLHPGQAIHTSLAQNVANTLVDMGFYPSS